MRERRTMVSTVLGVSLGLRRDGGEMVTVIKFTQRKIGQLGMYGYGCDTPGDQSGEYVPLSEWQAMYAELRDDQEKFIHLIHRLSEIGPGLTVKNNQWKGTALELEQLLADCREAIEARLGAGE